MKSSPKHTRFTLICTVVLLCLIGLVKSDQPSIQSLSLYEMYNQTQLAYNYQYYELTFNITDNLLMITVDQDSQSYIGIYLSLRFSGSNEVYYTYPNETHNTQECDQSSLDTCIIRFDELLGRPSQVTVYFSIYSYSDISYNIMAVLEDIYSAKVTSKYRIDFTKYETGLIEITGDQTVNLEELVMIMSYNTSGVAGKFKAVAAVDEMPSGTANYKYIHGITVGAYNKILKLPPISSNSSYYILIEGQKGTKFSVRFVESTPSAPTIGINQTIIYETNNNITYMAHTTFENIDLPLYINLDAFSGYGIFNVNYCNGVLKSIFQNLNGENGQVSITPGERLYCQQSMKSTSFGLLVENIEISIVNVNYNFGYQIGIYEGYFASPVRLNEQKYGIFLSSEDNRTYSIEIYQYNVAMVFTYLQITDSNESQLLFELQECQKKKNRDKCKTIASSIGSQGGSLSFIPKINNTYDVKVSYPESNQTVKLEFVVSLSLAQANLESILPSKLYFEQIEENQYKFYSINLTRVKDEQKIKVKNLSELIIQVKQVNGQVALLTSLTMPNPTYDDFLSEKTDIQFSWNGKKTYYVNETTEMVYVGIRGYEEALYYLQYTLDVDADIPARYTKLPDGTQNNFILSADNTYELLTFSSHFIPYKIFVTGSPKCIKYGYSLPLNQTCVTELPKQFDQKVVYLNISNGNTPNNYKFSVYVNSGDYLLNDKDPLLIGCISTCYEIVTVPLAESSKVIHQGRGSISQVTNSSNSAYNAFLNLSCKTYPCAVQINATLPYGGEMTLFLESSGILEVDWQSIPITFGGQAKRCIFTLRPWSDINSILIYSEALQLEVYYNIIDIHETKTNIMTYQFPTPTKFEGKSPGNPLRNVHVVQIDNSLLASKGCASLSSFCVVALSLYPNRDIEYNEEYLNGGIGYISSNTYQYFLPLNSPYELQEKFSMSYFTHKKHAEESSLQKLYRVNIEPLSNCHPKLYTGVYYDNPTFDTPTYDDAYVSYFQNWINFTVLAEKACRYRVSLTNSPLETVSQNKYYTLETKNKVVNVVYRSEYSPTNGFNIEVDTGSIFEKVDYILVNKVNEYGEMKIPTIKNSTHIDVNRSSLFVNETESYNVYVISIMTNSKSIGLLIRKDSPILLNHNQEHTQLIKQGGLMSYKIYSTGSIALFMTTTSQYPTITINKNYNSTKLVSQTISNKSAPWIYINATSSDLTLYDITINNYFGTEDISIGILFEENDVLAYQRLYEGIIVYDSFVLKHEVNCYYYPTPFLVGRKDLVVDFVMRQPVSQNFNLMYRAFTKDNTVKSSIQKLSSNPTTFRIDLEFIMNQNYTICFHSPNVSILNHEYYVLINDPGMEHLVEDYTLTQSNENSYDMYEIVEEGFNENVMIELTTCNPTSKNEKVLVGSSSFADSEMGRFTDLVDYHKNKDSIFAKLSVSEGYYYFGVKNVIYLNEFLNAYTIRFQNIGSDTKLLANTWELKSNKILKFYRDSENETKFTVQVPEIVNINKSIAQNNITIVYIINILNLTDYSDASRIPLNILARCPDYHQSKLDEGMGSRRKDIVPVLPINKTLTFFYDNLTDYQQKFTTPIFTFHQSELPNKFNITGRIEVKSNNQKFSYYYDTSYSQIDPRQVEETTGTFALLIFTLLISVALLTAVVIYLYFTYRKKQEEKKKVAFEMANFNHAEGESTQRREQREPFTTPKKQKGYGEFQDEIS